MANLIITVISIALVAVAALMGAYYGGTAFMNGQANAKANEISNDFEQVAAALTLYRTNGGTITLSSTGTNLSFLVPSYMTAIPTPGAEGAVSAFVSPSSQIYLFNPAQSFTNSVLSTYIDSPNICKQIEAKRLGTVPTNQRTYIDSGDSNVTFTGKIGCFFDPNNQWSSDKKRYIAYYTQDGSPNP